MHYQIIKINLIMVIYNFSLAQANDKNIKL